jgi:hypothetical protein
MQGKDRVVAQGGFIARIVAVVDEAARPWVHPVEPSSRADPQSSIAILVNDNHLILAQAPLVGGVVPVV